MAVLKRIVYDPRFPLGEDEIIKKLDSPNICKALASYRTERVLDDGSVQTLI